MKLAARSITIGVLCLGAWLATAGSALATSNGAAIGNAVTPWAISCSSAGNCSVVGTYAYASPFPELVIFNERNGAWKAGVEPKLPTAQSSDEWALVANDVTDLKRMDDISCPANGDCVAIGEYVDSVGNVRFARFTEQNGTWQRGVLLQLPANAVKPKLTASLAPSADIALTSVSCASVGNCAVVGTYQTGGKLEGLLFTEVGGKWSRGVEAPLPGTAATAEVAGFDEVSCAPDGTCTATGTWLTSSGLSYPWTLSESGGTIVASTSISLPIGADTTSSDNPLASGVSISCPEAGYCLGGGYYSDTYINPAPVLFSQSAGVWSSTGLTLPAGAAPSTSVNAQSAAVGPVWCAAAGDCSGALSYKDAYANNQIGLFTETAGVAGSTMAATLPANSTTDHTGDELAYASMIGCPSAGNCVLVGSYNTKASSVLPLILTERNGVWASGIQGDEPSNAGSQANGLGLELVACPADGACSAVGEYAVGTHNLEGYVDPMNGWDWGSPAELKGPGAVAQDYHLALSLIVMNDGTTLKKIKSTNGFATDAVFIRAGTLSANWYAPYKGKQTLIASLSTTGKAMRDYSAKVKLTSAGKSLLASAKSVKVTASGRYVAKGIKTVKMTERFTLK